MWTEPFPVKIFLVMLAGSKFTTAQCNLQTDLSKFEDYDGGGGDLMK